MENKISKEDWEKVKKCRQRVEKGYLLTWCGLRVGNGFIVFRIYKDGVETIGRFEEREDADKFFDEQIRLDNERYID